MFSRKYKLPTVCDNYLNVYDKCNIGCSFCKFNKDISEVKLKVIDFKKYKNQKVLVCYSVDPYPLNYDEKIIPSVIEELHNNNCNIVFLTRRADCLTKDINVFNKGDYIGVSISENCTNNSLAEDIEKLLDLANKFNIKTWISLEPIETFEFTYEIIKKYKDKVDIIRVGKNDLNHNKEIWETIKLKTNELNIKNVFVKE